MAAAPPSVRPRIHRSVITLVAVYFVTAAVLWWLMPTRPRFRLGTSDQHYRYPVLSPDGSLLAVSYFRPGPQKVDEAGTVLGPDPRTLRDVAVELRSSADGRLVVEWKINGLLGGTPPLRFSPDGRRLVGTFPNGPGQRIELWDTDAQCLTATWTVEYVNRYGLGGLHSQSAALLGPGGRAVRMSGWAVFAKEVILWNEVDGRERILPSASWPVALAPDGRTLVTGGQELSRDYVRDQVRGALLAAIGAPQWAAPGAAVAHCGDPAYPAYRHPYISFARPEVQVWDLDSVTRRAVCSTPSTRYPSAGGGTKELFRTPVAMAFSRSGQMLAVVLQEKDGHKTCAAELDTLTGVWSQPIEFWPYIPDNAALRYLPGERRLLVDLETGLGPASFLIDLDTKKVQGVGELETAVVRPDGGLLAYRSSERFRGNLFELMAGVSPPKTPPPSVVQVHDPATDEVRNFCSVPSEIGELAPLAFSSDGRYLVVRYYGGEGWGSVWNQAIHGRSGVRLYDTVDGRFALIPQHFNPFLSPPSVAFSTDGHSLAIWSEGRVGVYDIPLRTPWPAIAGWSFLPAALVWLLGHFWIALRRRRVVVSVG